MVKSREYIAKMEVKLARLSDSQLLLDHVGRQQQIIDSMQSQLDKAVGASTLKEEINKSLEKELDTLHRAFDVQDRYETPRSFDSGNSSAIQVDREKMRSLYYELGKRQSDSHSLTLTLADTSIEIGRLKQSLKDAAAMKVKMDEDRAALRMQHGIQLEKTNELRDELFLNQDKISKLKDTNSNMTAQIEDISRRLSELRSTTDVTITEKETLIFELSSLLYASQLEVVSLTGRVEELKQSVSMVQSSSELSEQRSLTSLNNAIAERQALTELLQEAELMKPELNMVHQHLEDAIEEKNKKHHILEAVRQSSDKDIAQARNIAEDLQRELDVTQQQLEIVQNRENDLEEERAHALTTLQRTLEAAKSLTLKLQSEKEKRIIAEERANKAERLAETLQRAKEHVSSAVLDALHMEKSKSVRLEKVLQQMTSSRDYIPFPRPGSATTSPSRAVRTSDNGYVRTSDNGYEYERAKVINRVGGGGGGGDSQHTKQYARLSSSPLRQSYSVIPITPPRNAVEPSSSSPRTASALVIAEHRKSIPSFSQSSPSRMIANNLQHQIVTPSVRERERERERDGTGRGESWKVLEIAVDSGVDVKRSLEILDDDRMKQFRANIIQHNPDYRVSVPQNKTGPSPSRAIVDGLTRYVRANNFEFLIFWISALYGSAATILLYCLHSSFIYLLIYLFTYLFIY